MILVKKADGRKEEFSPGKILNTCMRAGLSRKAAENIVRKVEARLFNGIRTHDIYEMVLKELERIEDRSSMVFRLREAVSEIPSDKFELYVKKILESYGYKCQWNVLVEGKYVEHQVDILAEKGGKKYLVECKHHINPHRFCGLGIVLQVQGRLEDVQDGYRERKNRLNFSGAWVITNTKFSEHAKMYANGRGIMLSGWKYKAKGSLESMIQAKKLYPICIIKMDKSLKKTLFERDIITIQDAIGAEIKDKKASEYIKTQARLLA